MAVVGVAEDSVVVEQSGHSLCVRSAHDREGVAGPERVLRAEPGRTAVVVHASAADAVRRLDHRVLDVLGRAVSRDAAGRPASLRLLLSAGACPGSDGTPAVAARLAHHLGVEVVAPDGALLVSQRGELFSAGATAGWWALVPGRSPALGSGPRFPAPAWQWHLPPDVAVRASTVDAAVTPVPAGLWVRAAGSAAAPLSDPGFAVPASPARMALLAGRPGEQPPPVEALAGLVRSLPAQVRNDWVLIPYGEEPGTAASLAQRLADRLGADVLATHAVPFYTPDGSLQLAAVDGSGRPTWRPLLAESRYHAGAHMPEPWTWWSLDLEQLGPGRFRLCAGWVVLTTPSGLLIHPADEAVEPELLRRPTDPDAVDLVVTASWSGAVHGAVLDGIHAIVRALPPAARRRLRIAAAGEVDPAVLAGVARALEVPVGRLVLAMGLVGRPGQPATAGQPGPAGRPGGQPAPAGPAIGRLHASAVPVVAGSRTAVLRAPSPGTPALAGAGAGANGPSRTAPPRPVDPSARTVRRGCCRRLRRTGMGIQPG